MNDFAQEKDAPFGISAAGGVSEIDGAFDAIAKAEFLGQFDRQIAGRKDVAAGADALDQFAPVMGKDLGLHRSHDVGPPQIDFLGQGRRFR